MAAVGDAPPGQRVSVLEVIAILLAGFGAGVINAVVGAGTLVTFSTLLLLGYPPIVANVSNTLGLVPGSLTAAYAFRSSLHGRGRLVRTLVAVAVVGGVIGAFLLIGLPPRAFELVVPALLVVAAALAVLQPRIAAAVTARRERSGRPDLRVSDAVPPLLAAGVLATSIYGGYFGAAQGVLMLVVLGLITGSPLNELNGVKNILVAMTNLVSALVFMVIADIDWTVAGLIAVGATAGGAVGGTVGRRISAAVLRTLIVTVALVAAALRIL